MSRASEINHRLVDIANGEAERIICEVHNRESPKQTCVVGIDWSFGLDDLVEIVQCFRGESLAIIYKVMAQEYRPGFSIRQAKPRQAETAQDEQNPAHLGPVLQDLQDACLVLGSYPLSRLHYVQLYS
jgi:hypothetical protein